MREYQQEIQLNTLYECTGYELGDGDTLQPFIEIVGGEANIYGCVARPGNPPTDMSAGTTDPFEGILNFSVIPNFLYITEHSGSIVSIILSGVRAQEATTA